MTNKVQPERASETLMYDPAFRQIRREDGSKVG
jgi:hypothetical protein